MKVPALITCLLTAVIVTAQSIVSDKIKPGYFDLADAVICVDSSDHKLVRLAAEFLQSDIEKVTGKKRGILNRLDKPYKTVIMIGSIDRSLLIKDLVKEKKVNLTSITNKWEAYQVKNIQHPWSHVENLLVITGSDRRGTAYGVFELSKQIGVSPWYWWADVPVKKKPAIYISNKLSLSDAPKVKYRGIFINDEAPALSNWSKEKFGGFNHLFYSKVFELLLRLKSNYIWPAMWGNAFYDDDAENIKVADEYGIVIGTSHHEPLMRAHDEWRRYGSKQKWNYDSTEAGLKEFWRGGMQRATNEKIVSVGMRGDGDEPMTRETATALLERIVKDQRQIIADVTGKPADQTPQLWALYKEVQDYYDKGMRVPDDVTLLLCDDNWGNIRKLPKLDEAPRKGGYGIYYHFDYVGGPRNYKWLNTNPIPRVWEQMHMAWEYKARQIWIVNVGDIKPMEFPISFFLDYAWDPEKIGADDLKKYTEQWAVDQFGSQHAVAIADIISKYGKYNGRRKPELLDANTYSMESFGEIVGEADRVTQDYETLLEKAEQIAAALPKEYQDAYYQLVLHPVKACANLQRLYTTVAHNREAARGYHVWANTLADRAKKLYENDSLITLEYHRLNNGKWNHMMSQTHIGYTYWQQPPVQQMPVVKYVPQDSAAGDVSMIDPLIKTSLDKIPAGTKGNVFFQSDNYVSIEADHYSKATSGKGINWKVLPDLGKTGSAITSWPVTAPAQKPGVNSPQLQYDIYVSDAGKINLQAYFSPTLNFHNTPEGLQYAISIDDEQPQIVSINKEDNNVQQWNRWVANNIIIKNSTHTINKPGKHVVKYWMVNSGVVLQKVVLSFGNLKPSYLGPPETRMGAK
jgi:hypothetical protein